MHYLRLVCMCCKDMRKIKKIYDIFTRVIVWINNIGLIIEQKYLLECNEHSTPTYSYY